MSNREQPADPTEADRDEVEGAQEIADALAEYCRKVPRAYLMQQAEDCIRGMRRVILASQATPKASGEQPADPQRSALKGCVAAMEMQNGRWDESLHIHASVFGPIWDEALNDGRAALAAMNEPPEPSVGHQTERAGESPEAAIEGPSVLDCLKSAIDCVEERVHFVRGSLLHVTVKQWKRVAFAAETQQSSHTAGSNEKSELGSMNEGKTP